MGRRMSLGANRRTFCPARSVRRKGLVYPCPPYGLTVRERGQGEGACSAGLLSRCRVARVGGSGCSYAVATLPPHPSPLPQTVKLSGGKGTKHGGFSEFGRANKKPAGAGFFERTTSVSYAAAMMLSPAFPSKARERVTSGDRLDVRGQAALVAGGLVAMDQATAGVAVEHRLGGLVGGFRGGPALGFDGLQHLADRRAQHRALAGVAHPAHFGLAGALLGGLDVGHGVTPEQSGEMKPASIAESGVSVNPRGSRRNRGQSAISNWSCDLPMPCPKLHSDPGFSA